MKICLDVLALLVVVPIGAFIFVMMSPLIAAMLIWVAIDWAFERVMDL